MVTLGEAAWRDSYSEAEAQEPQIMVNLNLAHSLLVAAESQASGFLNVRGVDLVREVERMAEAGLVDASLGNAGTAAFAVINRITEQGHAFLRAFKNQQPPKTEIARVIASAKN